VVWREKTMPKDKNVGIKIELVKDTRSGKLKMVAHFNSNSPNVIIENNEYIWIPTMDEKELIDEAFSFIPLEKTSKTSSNLNFEPELPVEEEEPKPESTFEKKPEIPKPSIHKEPEEKMIDTPTFEKEEPTVFEVTKEESFQAEENIEEEVEKELEKKQNKNPMVAKVKIKQSEPEMELDEEKTDKKNPEDEGVIVEADADAIEAALKRHVGKEDRDDSFKEVDEQTIIDRVLSQKKKGKWVKK
jgi:hypothetical protein